MAVNFSDSTPTAPTGSVNLKWQKDVLGNVSGYTTASVATNAQTGTSYTIVAGDRATLVTLSNASSVAVTLPQATVSFAAGWFTDLWNLGSGTVTITPTTSTIHGASTYTLTTDQGVRIVSDGTNYKIASASGTATGGGSGTVTSVALTVPSWLSVSGSPVTTSGTLAVSAATGQTANQVLATPNGSSGAAGLRTLVAADIPNLDTAKITTGTIATARLGSGTADNTTFLRGDNTWVVPTGGGSGSVTSVALTVPSWLSVSGSPVTSSGTLAVTATTGQTANLFLATPNGSTGSVTLRAIVQADLPAQPYDIACSLTGKPGASAIVLILTATRAVTFPGNFSGSYGSVGTNPTSTATYTVLKNGSSIGTVAISTSGTFTFATASGASQSLAAGDRLTITAPSSQDATLSDVSFTITGTR